MALGLTLDWSRKADPLGLFSPPVKPAEPPKNKNRVRHDSACSYTSFGQEPVLLGEYHAYPIKELLAEPTPDTPWLRCHCLMDMNKSNTTIMPCLQHCAHKSQPPALKTKPTKKSRFATLFEQQKRVIVKKNKTTKEQAEFQKYCAKIDKWAKVMNDFKLHVGKYRAGHVGGALGKALMGLCT
jgi:hypothetical protein